MIGYTPLNLEQSIARYLANKFKDMGYSVFWWDSKRTEGTGRQVTFLRSFPTDSANFIRQSSDLTGPTLVKLPVFTVFVQAPKTTREDRLGIGESVFDWKANVRIDGFADNELEWYQIQGWFAHWLNPDVRTSVYDYEADLTDPTPSELETPIQYNDVDVLRDELYQETSTMRYYLTAFAKAEFPK